MIGLMFHDMKPSPMVTHMTTVRIKDSFFMIVVLDDDEK
jgi:hypothetical protein